MVLDYCDNCIGEYSNFKHDICQDCIVNPNYIPEYDEDIEDYSDYEDDIL